MDGRVSPCTVHVSESVTHEVPETNAERLQQWLAINKKMKLLSDLSNLKHVTVACNTCPYQITKPWHYFTKRKSFGCVCNGRVGASSDVRRAQLLHILATSRLVSDDDWVYDTDMWKAHVDNTKKIDVGLVCVRCQSGGCEALANVLKGKISDFCTCERRHRQVPRRASVTKKQRCTGALQQQEKRPRLAIESMPAETMNEASEA